MVQLGKEVSATAKDFRQRVQRARDRRALRAEQESDEAAAKQARAARVEALLSQNQSAVEEAEVLLDNVVSHFQSLSSRNNRAWRGGAAP